MPRRTIDSPINRGKKYPDQTWRQVALDDPDYLRRHIINKRHVPAEEQELARKALEVAAGERGPRLEVPELTGRPAAASTPEPGAEAASGERAAAAPAEAVVGEPAEPAVAAPVPVSASAAPAPVDAAEVTAALKALPSSAGEASEPLSSGARAALEMMLANQGQLLIWMHGISLSLVFVSWLVAVRALEFPMASAHEAATIGVSAMLALWCVETLFARRHLRLMAAVGAPLGVYRQLASWPLQGLRLLTGGGLLCLLLHEWAVGRLQLDPRLLIAPAALLVTQLILLLEPWRILGAQRDEDQLHFLEVRLLACHLVALLAAALAAAICAGGLLSQIPGGLRYDALLYGAAVVIGAWFLETLIHRRHQHVAVFVDGLNGAEALRGHRDLLARLPLHGFFLASSVGMLAIASGPLKSHPLYWVPLLMLVLQLISLAQPWRLWGREVPAEEHTRQLRWIAHAAYLVTLADRALRGRSMADAPTRGELQARAEQFLALERRELRLQAAEARLAEREAALDGGEAPAPKPALVLPSPELAGRN